MCFFWGPLGVFPFSYISFQYFLNLKSYLGCVFVPQLLCWYGESNIPCHNYLQFSIIILALWQLWLRIWKKTRTKNICGKERVFLVIRWPICSLLHLIGQFWSLSRIWKWNLQNLGFVSSQWYPFLRYRW